MGAAASTPVPVAAVNLARYAGLWHQIGALPTWFQDPYAWNTTATYTYSEDGNGPRLDIVNRSETYSGTREIRGVARPDYSCIAETPGRADSIAGCLRVTFTPSLSNPIVWPLPAPYWILELADDYRYAVVGNPRRTMLWILARATTLSQEDERYILQRLLTVHGYAKEDVARIARSTHHAPAQFVTTDDDLQL